MVKQRSGQEGEGVGTEQNQLGRRDQDKEGDPAKEPEVEAAARSEQGSRVPPL